jgi:hypothetical protein
MVGVAWLGPLLAPAQWGDHRGQQVGRGRSLVWGSARGGDQIVVVCDLDGGGVLLEDLGV